MNDPKVVALIYTVEPIGAGRYDKAGPLRYSSSPEFDLTVENKIARFELKNFYADEDEAREAIKPFIEHWEFKASMQVGPGNFRLRFKEAEIINRKPSPPEPGIRKLRASLRIPAPTITARISHSKAEYPSPPAGGSVDLKDDYVVKMKCRYDQYRMGDAKLPDVAYFFVTVLADKYGTLSAAAKACGISRNVLEEIRKLSSYKGGEDSRKTEGFGDAFTMQEKRFLKAALKEIVIRAAQVAADDSQRQPQFTMEDLTSI